MAAKGGAGNQVIRIEDVLAMLPRWEPVVDNQRQDNIASRRFSIRNVLRPAPHNRAVTRDPLARVAAISAFVSKSPTRLVRAMIGGGAAHSLGKRERRQCLGVLQEPDRFI